MIPSKLKKGDGVRVIAPSRSMAMPWIQACKNDAIQKFKDLGFDLSFGEHVEEIDEFSSSSIQSRVADIHAAFADKNIKLVITVIGGFNVNQLLRYLDYDLIRNNPKILCGFSDITALANAIHAKTGIVTYSGPHFFCFGDKKGFDYTLDYFRNCLMLDDTFEVLPCEKWSDDRWTLDQENRNFLDNEGYWIINKGEAQGKIIGGNLGTFNLLWGTEYMPDINKSVLFIEDCVEGNDSIDVEFDRLLQSLIYQPGFETVKGIVIGRFEPAAKLSEKTLRKIISTKKELQNIPIIANADFGHTQPLITFPIGGTASIKADNKVELKIIEH